MDNREAIALLEQEFDRFRGESWADLVRRIDLDPVVLEPTGPDGTKYQVEILCMWDGPRGGNVLVMGSIDDGLWRAFIPITRSFIKAADGSFVGE